MDSYTDILTNIQRELDKLHYNNIIPDYLLISEGKISSSAKAYKHHGKTIPIMQCKELVSDFELVFKSAKKDPTESIILSDADFDILIDKEDEEPNEALIELMKEN